KSMRNNRNNSPPTNAPSIPTPMLAHNPKPRLVKVIRRPASVPASAPIISQTMSSPIDMIEYFLPEECLYLAAQQNTNRSLSLGQHFHVVPVGGKNRRRFSKTPFRTRARNGL